MIKKCSSFQSSGGNGLSSEMQTPSSSSSSRRRHRRHFRRRPPPLLRHNFSAQTFGLQVAQPRKCARGAEKNVPPTAISASTAAATCTNENQRTKDGLKIEEPKSSPSSRDGRLFSFPVLLHFLWPLGATSTDLMVRAKLSNSLCPTLYFLSGGSIVR